MNVPSGKIHSGYQGCHGCVLQEVFILADHFPSVPVSTVFILSCTTELVSAHRRQGGSSQSLIDRTCWSGRRVRDESPSGLVIWALYCASCLFPPMFTLALHSVASSDDSRLISASQILCYNSCHSVPWNRVCFAYCAFCGQLSSMEILPNHLPFAFAWAAEDWTMTSGVLC
jgi:hypothetical protein